MNSDLTKEMGFHLYLEDLIGGVRKITGFQDFSILASYFSILIVFLFIKFFLRKEK
jgi:hypothetical protein